MSVGATENISNIIFILRVFIFMESKHCWKNKITRIAYERNCPLLFNISATYIFELYLDSVMSILPYINNIIGSAEVSGIKYSVINKNNYLLKKCV